MPRPRLPRRLRRALLGLLLAAVALEVVLQVARPAVLDRVRERAFPVAAEDAGYVTLQPINFDPVSGLPLLVYDPDAFWVMAPGRRGAYFLTEDVRTNALGMRGPDLPPRAADELRLLFLGDSVTFGMRVGEAERYSEQLAARLRAGQPGRTVTPVNAGVIGYAATQVRARLPAWLDAAQPDVVCLAVGLNDCIRLPASDAQFRVLTTSTWERVRHGVRSSQLVCAAELGWAWLRREAGALRGSPRRAVAQWLHYPSLPREGSHVPRTSETDFFALLDEIHGVCRDRGVALVLITEYASAEVPSERLRDKGFFERLESLCTGLREFGAHRGLPVADARAALERSGRPPEELLLDFCHPSPAGHALIAEELQRAIEVAGLLASWRVGGERR